MNTLISTITDLWSALTDMWAPDVPTDGWCASVVAERVSRAAEPLRHCGSWNLRGVSAAARGCSMAVRR